MTAILIVLTSHATLGDTGRSTGFYVSEAAHPWTEFTKAGHTVTVASILGGDPPRDGDPAGHEDFLAALGHDTPAVADVDPAAFDAVLLAGGHGTMWDFPSSTALQSLVRQVYERGGVIGAVCHGPAGLVDVTLTGGGHLVAGRNVAGFTDEEEHAAGLAEVVPFALQRRLEGLGARHTGAAPWQPWVVRDGRLVTGQNPASAAGVAQAMLDALEDREAVTVTAAYFAAEGRRDLDAVVGCFAEDARFVTPDGATLTGRAELRRFYAANMAALPSLRVDLLDDVSAGHRSALRWRATGTTAAGERVDMHGTNVVTVREGRFTEFHAYWLTSR